jgi:hypothetical protein
MYDGEIKMPQGKAQRYTEADLSPKYLKCPTCGVEQGHFCLTKSGKQAGKMHQTRINAMLANERLMILKFKNGDEFLGDDLWAYLPQPSIEDTEALNESSR